MNPIVFAFIALAAIVTVLAIFVGCMINKWQAKWEKKAKQQKFYAADTSHHSSAKAAKPTPKPDPKPKGFFEKMGRTRSSWIVYLEYREANGLPNSGNFVKPPRPQLPLMTAATAD